jgi:hypothetical protein
LSRIVVRHDAGARLIITLRRGQPSEPGTGRFRLSVSATPRPFTVVDVPARLRPALSTPRAGRTDAQRRDVAGPVQRLSGAEADARPARRGQKGCATSASCRRSS